jgi:hypothetical protein
MATPLGMLGVDAFTIMEIVGHSRPESVERAVAKLDVSNWLPRGIGVGIELGISDKKTMFAQNRRKSMK